MAADQDVASGMKLSGLMALVRRRERALLVGLISLNLLPIWAFPYFPSLDGPAHVSLTYWLVHYSDPALPIFREFFEPNFEVFPNYLIFIILYPLMLVFPAAVAEKILISLYAVCLPLALRFALRGLAPAAGAFAAFGAVLTFHQLLLLGFYNTSFAIAVFLLTIGCWLRWRDRMSPATLGGYVALGGFAYITHLSAVAATCLAIFFATVGLIGRDVLAGDRSVAWRRFLSHGIWPALGFAPAIALCLAFMARGDGEMAAAGVAGFALPGLQRIVDLVRLQALIGHAYGELVLTLGLFVILYLFARQGIRHSQTKINAGLFIFLGFLALYLTVPFQFDVRWMPTRMMPYVVLGSIVWIAAMTVSLPIRRQQTLRAYAIIAAVTIVVAGTGLRLVRWSEISDLTAEYMSGNHLIEPNSTLLALRLSNEIDGTRPSDVGISIFLQTVGYIATETGTVDLKHFQAHTGVFPLIFRDGVNPYVHLARDADFVGAPETIDPSLYTDRTGRPVDYVLLWGDQDALPPDSPLARDLQARYDLIHTSAPIGAMRLFRLGE